MPHTGTAACTALPPGLSSVYRVSQRLLGLFSSSCLCLAAGRLPLRTVSAGRPSTPCSDCRVKEGPAGLVLFLLLHLLFASLCCLPLSGTSFWCLLLLPLPSCSCLLPGVCLAPACLWISVLNSLCSLALLTTSYEHTTGHPRHALDPSFLSNQNTLVSEKVMGSLYQ